MNVVAWAVLGSLITGALVTGTLAIVLYGVLPALAALYRTPQPPQPDTWPVRCYTRGCDRRGSVPRERHDGSVVWKCRRCDEEITALLEARQKGTPR